MRQLSLLGVVVAVACNGRLTVPGDDPGSGGSAGHDVGVAGHGDIGIAGGITTPAGGNNGSGGNWIGVSGQNGVAGEGPFGTGGSPPGAGGDSVGGKGPVGTAGGIGTGGSWNGTGGSIGTAGGFGTAGGGGNPVGNLGQPCIPGGLVTEADGTPAKTQIKTLPRCAEGLACDTTGTCVVAPDCPQNGNLCVVRHAALGDGGAGGALSGPDKGCGGESHDSWTSGGNGSIVSTSTEKSGVLSLAASDSRVYWVEYGTRDALGNYQHDGALLSYAIDDGTTTVVASGLDGPVRVELTTSHAYVYVDGGRPIGAVIHSQLFRVPLGGGSAELVQEGTQANTTGFNKGVSTGFAAANGRAFWNTAGGQSDGSIYTIASDSGSVPTVFVTGFSYSLTADATDLYYAGVDGLMKAPIAGGTPVSIAAAPPRFVLHDDQIFALEPISAGTLLSQAPKSGGEFVRIRGLGSTQGSGLRAIGDRYFFEGVPSLSNCTAPTEQYVTRVLSASFDPNSQAIQLLERPDRRSFVNHLWVGTANALYWSEGRAIYKQAIPTP